MMHEGFKWWRRVVQFATTTRGSLPHWFGLEGGPDRRSGALRASRRNRGKTI